MAKSRIGRAMSRMWGGVKKRERGVDTGQMHGPKLPDRGVLHLTKEMMVKPGQKADWSGPVKRYADQKRARADKYEAEMNARNKKFDESKHPRNKGKFASKGGASKKSRTPRLGKGMRQINKEQGEGGGQRWKKVVT